MPDDRERRKRGSVLRPVPNHRRSCVLAQIDDCGFADARRRRIRSRPLADERHLLHADGGDAGPDVVVRHPILRYPYGLHFSTTFRSGVDNFARQTAVAGRSKQWVVMLTAGRNDDDDALV